MRDDRALERRALRKVVDVGCDPMEDEPQDVRVAVPALAHELEPALKSHDVRLRREVLGELRIEQPRRADRQAGRGLREMAREEGLRAPERIVARHGCQRSTFGYVYADRRLALRKCGGHMRRANAHAIELKTA